MHEVIEQVLDSDIVVHAVPTWFWGAPAQFKCYLDRYTQLFTKEWTLRDEVKERTKGLTFAGLVTCGAPNHEETTSGIVLAMKSLASFVEGWRWAGSETASAQKIDDEVLKKAFELGKAAVAKALEE